MRSEVLLYFTHVVSDSIKSVVRALRLELDMDIWIIGLCKNRSDLDAPSIIGPYTRLSIFWTIYACSHMNGACLPKIGIPCVVNQT